MINDRYNYLLKTDNVLENRDYLVRQYILYMLNRTSQMFEYSGLPETIPQKDLETILQLRGFVTIASHNGNLYALDGSLGGLLNEYYHPVNSNVANPYLKCNKTFTNNVDCVVMLNDTNYLGLNPLLLKYSNLLADADISIRVALINNRLNKMITCDNDKTKMSAEKYLKDIENGKLGVMGSKPFFEGLKVDNTTLHQGNLKELIEIRNYIESKFFIDLGLNANWNAKRESLNESETSLNDDILFPTIDDMLKMREDAIDKINKMFNTSICVRLASSWGNNKNEYKLSIDKLKTENTLNNDVGGADDDIERMD